MSLRIGVKCAVFDQQNHILLSRRGDFNAWNLPGGRLDPQEALTDAAVREVEEETGLVVEVERAVGLYYWAGRRRMDVLFSARQVGGALQQSTDETRENRFFPPDDMPEMPFPIFALDAVAAVRHKPRVIEIPAVEFWQFRAALGVRWIQNLLRGKPEPRYPTFDVRTVGLVWDDAHRRVLTQREPRDSALPSVVCEGDYAPWEDLEDVLWDDFDVDAAFRWVGVWQDVYNDYFEFVFAATLPPDTPHSLELEWSAWRNAGLSGRDADFVSRVNVNYATSPVWLVAHRDSAEGVINVGEGNSV